MADAERLARLCNELVSDPRYVTGSKRFPLSVSDGEAVAMAEALAEEFDEGVRARAAQAERQGLHIHCHAGCSTCCGILVSCYLPESLRITEFLKQPEQAEVKAAFVAAYPSWRERTGDLPEQAMAAFSSGQQARYDELHQAHFRKAIPCAFLVEGRCSIYPVRPLGCRNAHALDTAANCVADPADGRPAQAVEFVPLSRLLRSANQLFHAAHNAKSRERHGQKSVCVAVYELLTRPPRR